MEQDNQGMVDEASKDIIKSKKRKNKLIALILVVLLILIFSLVKIILSLY